MLVVSAVSVATGVDEAGAGSCASAALSESVVAGGGGAVTPLSTIIDEVGAPWSESVWLGGMLGGMATGAVAVSGTTGAMTSVRASDAGTSGGGGGAG